MLVVILAVLLTGQGQDRAQSPPASVPQPLEWQGHAIYRIAFRGPDRRYDVIAPAIVVNHPIACPNAVRWSSLDRQFRPGGRSAGWACFLGPVGIWQIGSKAGLVMPIRPNLRERPTGVPLPQISRPRA
jgi:hypothetical protein